MSDTGLWRVYTRATPTSPWRDVGVIESDRITADKIWPKIVRDLRLDGYKLVPEPRSNTAGGNYAEV